MVMMVMVMVVLLDADRGVFVPEDGASAEACPGKTNWNGVRGRGVLRGSYQFDVQMPHPCLIRIGWASLQSKRNFGNDARSFGYGGTGLKSTARTFEKYGREFKGLIGVVISCLIDRTNSEDQTISYCLNGEHLGVALKLPEELTDVPLFPAVCGKDDWEVTLHCGSAAGLALRCPVAGFSPLANALSAGHAVVGPAAKPFTAPKGKPVSRADHCEVQPGRRVVLHVSDVPWQGWHVCDVLEADENGCYLRHEDDGFTENVPWSYLAGSKFAMELLGSKGRGTDEGTPLVATNTADGAHRFEPELNRILSFEELRRILNDEQELNFMEKELLEHWANLEWRPAPCHLPQNANTSVRKGILRVAGNGVGAGMVMSCNRMGYFVENLDQEPGQKDLRRGFVIVAIGGLPLTNLEPEQVEDRFGSEYRYAVVVAGPYHELKREAASEVRKQVFQLMDIIDEVSIENQGLHRASTEPPPTLTRKISLRVCPEQGAGLNLEACDQGFFVDGVEDHPGQDGLGSGDIILAIGGISLVGLTEDQVHELFGYAFSHGVALLVGRRSDVGGLSVADLQQVVERMLTAELVFDKLERTKS